MVIRSVRSSDGDTINTSSAFKLLMIKFESSTVVLKILTTFGVAVGDTLLVVEFEVEDRYQSHKYVY
jgi:hypothetical protein